MHDRLDVGAVVRRVFDIYVDQAPVLMPAAAVVFVIAGILEAILASGGAGLALIGELISLVAITLFTGMIVQLVADLQDGKRDSSPTQLLQAVTPVLGTLLLVAVVESIGLLVGFVLLIVPGLILITFWAVAAPVVVIEHIPGIGALGRSRELVRGNGWQVFGVIVILLVMVLIVSLLIESLAASAGTGAGIVASVVVGILAAPIEALAPAVLYFELRRLAGTPAAGVGAPAPFEPASTVQPQPPAPPAEQSSEAHRAFGDDTR